MEENKQHIDKFFREGLGDHTELPPADVWASLEQRLDEHDKGGVATPRSYRWIWYALFFLVAGLVAYMAADRLSISTDHAAQNENSAKNVAKLSKDPSVDKGNGSGSVTGQLSNDTVITNLNGAAENENTAKNLAKLSKTPHERTPTHSVPNKKVSGEMENAPAPTTGHPVKKADIGNLDPSVKNENAAKNVAKRSNNTNVIEDQPAQPENVANAGSLENNVAKAEATPPVRTVSTRSGKKRRILVSYEEPDMATARYQEASKRDITVTSASVDEIKPASKPATVAAAPQRDITANTQKLTPSANNGAKVAKNNSANTERDQQTLTPANKGIQKTAKQTASPVNTHQAARNESATEKLAKKINTPKETTTENTGLAKVSKTDKPNLSAGKKAVTKDVKPAKDPVAAKAATKNEPPVVAKAQQNDKTAQLPVSKANDPVNPNAAITPSSKEQDIVAAKNNIEPNTEKPELLQIADKRPTAVVEPLIPQEEKKKRANKLPIDFGAKIGFEKGFGNYQANKIALAPYLQYNFNGNLSLMVQPTIKYAMLNTTSVDEPKSYHRITNSTLDSNHTIIPGDTTLPNPIPTMIKRFYMYSQTHDSIVSYNSINKNGYFELELPVMVQYRLVQGLSAYGGFTMNYSKLVKIQEQQKLYSITRHDSDLRSVVNLNAQVEPARPFEQYFKYNTPSYSQYTASPYSNATINPVRFSYTVGVNYVFDSHFMIDIMYMKMLSNTTYIPDARIRELYKQGYLRISLGYKFSK